MDFSPNIRERDPDPFLKGIIPDAFVVREKYPWANGQIMAIYEIEVAHPINYEKMLKILNCWMALDNCDIAMELNIVDRFGQIKNTLSDLDLDAMYWSPRWCGPGSK